MVEHFGRVHTVNGFAHRMTQSTAAICLAQLEIIQPQVEKRDRMIRLLSALLNEIPGRVGIADPTGDRGVLLLDGGIHHRSRAVPV